MADASRDYFSVCEQTVGTNGTDRAILQCVSNQIANELQATHGTPEHGMVLVLAAALVFMMQAGFAMVCAGAVRKKNVQNSMLKNLLDACGAAVAFYAFGYAFAFGGKDENLDSKTFIGTKNFFLYDFEDYAFWLFQFAFSAASTTIVAGTLAERCQMAAYLCYSIMLSGWVYPVIVHAIWSPHGFLSASSMNPLWGVGMVDYAGSGVVHVTGGTTAIIATAILGPRRGRFHDDAGNRTEEAREFRGHSVALQMLGTFLLWFGWYGFNSGSALLSLPPGKANQAAALAGANSTIAAGSAAIVAILLNLWHIERSTGEGFFDLKFAMNGCLSGLVAITAGCAVVEPWAAFITGSIAGILYFMGSYGLIRIRLDDAVDAIPVHLVCGAWGLIACGLFAAPKWLELNYGRSEHVGLIISLWHGDFDGTLLAAQLTGLVFIIGWVTTIMFPFYIWLDWKGWFRSDPLEEIVGLDLSYHGGMPLLAGDDLVKPEYLKAYQRKREQLAASKSQARRESSQWKQRTDPTNNAESGEDDEDDDVTTERPIEF